jgi:hypothetical protein
MSEYKLFPIVRYNCGCIGFKPNTITDGPMFAICLKVCDDDKPEYVMVYRDMQGHTFEPIEENEAKQIFKEISALIRDGNILRQIKNLLAS